MGNPQRSLDQSLGWIGGIIDGEGCFNMARVLNRKTKRLTAFNPNLIIVNTDDRIIAEINRIFTNLKIGHHISQRQPRKGNQLAVTDVSIKGLKRLAHALPILMPLLISKKSRAQAMLDFCNYRLSRPYNEPYTGEETKWIEHIRTENAAKNGRSKPLNDYTPGSFIYKDEDIV